MRHVHCVNVDFVEQRRRVVDGGQESDFRGLADLALVAGLDEPLDVSLECGPPKAIEEDAACGIEALVAELIMSVTDEGVSHGGAGVKLVPAAVLSSPESPSCDEEAVRSANKTCQRVCRKVGGGAPREQVLSYLLDLRVGLVRLVAGGEPGWDGVIVVEVENAVVVAVVVVVSDVGVIVVDDGVVVIDVVVVVVDVDVVVVVVVVVGVF